MFCVECGKEDPIFRDGTCISCYLKTHSFTKGPKYIDIFACQHCSSYKYKNTWIKESFDEAIIRHIKNSFEISKELDNVDISTECKRKNEIINCEVTISGLVDTFKITEKHDVTIREKRTVCEICSRQHGGYYEATIQIRADQRKLTKKELINIQLFIENLVEIIQEKGNRSLFITDMGKEHGGIDFYLSDNSSAQSIAKRINEKYGGEIKQSSKNVGMKDSRQIYRMTYLIRLPSYQKNDFISLNNRYYFVSTIRANRISLIDLVTWDEISFDSKTLENITIRGGEELIKEVILVSQTKDEVQIMDEKTYKIETIKKPKPIHFKQEKIKVVKINDKTFIFLEK